MTITNSLKFSYGSLKNEKRVIIKKNNNFIIKKQTKIID